MKSTSFKSFCITKSPMLMLFLFLFFFACNQQSENRIFSDDIKNATTIEGVWEFSSHYWVKDGDTLYPDPEETRIHKIFLDGYVMWTSDQATDSSEWHGFGTYQLNNDTLIEKMLSEKEVIFKIEYDNTSLKQSSETMFRSTDYQLIEEWKKLN